jgi:hypothetical protein
MPLENQNIELWSGDDVVIDISLVESDGEPMNHGPASTSSVGAGLSGWGH